jgi:hypothetical protein
MLRGGGALRSIALFHFSNAAVPARCLASPTVSPHTLDVIPARLRGGSDAPASAPRAAAGSSCGTAGAEGITADGTWPR